MNLLKMLVSLVWPVGIVPNDFRPYKLQTLLLLNVFKANVKGNFNLKQFNGVAGVNRLNIPVLVILNSLLNTSYKSIFTVPDDRP